MTIVVEGGGGTEGEEKSKVEGAAGEDNEEEEGVVMLLVVELSRVDADNTATSEEVSDVEEAVEPDDIVLFLPKKGGGGGGAGGVSTSTSISIKATPALLFLRSSLSSPNKELTIMKTPVRPTPAEQ